MEMESSGGSSSYYSILGVSLNCSDEEIRRAYRKLAMQWHPDKWTRTPTLLNDAKWRFQQIQEAYSVLSDPRKRTMYDAGLYDPDEEEDTDFADFLQEMASLMEDVKKEDKNYSMEDLQNMFWEMAQGFEFADLSSFPQDPLCDSPQWFCGHSTFGDPGGLGRSMGNSSRTGRDSHLYFPGLKMSEAR